MKQLGTLTPFAVGIIFVVAVAVVATGTFAFIGNLDAIAIVVIGSIIATVAGTPSADTIEALSRVRSLWQKTPDAVHVAQWWLELNLRWRRDGITALGTMIARAPCSSAAAIAQLCADGFDADTIAQLSEKLLASQRASFERAIGFFRRLAGYAPTMGIIGTVIGLASALGHSGDTPTALLHRIGFAFSATLWGLVTSNFVWLPIAQQLQALLDRTRQLDMLQLEAAKLIARGSVPVLTRYTLAMFLPDHARKAFLDSETFNRYAERSGAQ